MKPKETQCPISSKEIVQQGLTQLLKDISQKYYCVTNSPVGLNTKEQRKTGKESNHWKGIKPLDPWPATMFTGSRTNWNVAICQVDIIDFLNTE